MTKTQGSSRSVDVNLIFDKKLAKPYKSPSQKVRVMSEDWAEKNLYCVNCGGKLIHSPRKNEPVLDFYCKKCGEEFELKSKKSAFGKEIGGASYKKMIEKIKKGNLPNFFFLTYCPCCYWVNDLVLVPSHYFTKKTVRQANKPYSEDRPNEFGCFIKFGEIPSSGKLYLIKNKKVAAKNNVLSGFKKTSFLRKQKEDLRGWTLDVMNCIESLAKKKFTLDDVYRFEKHLKRRHPENNHVREKIREQLQVLRDRHRYLKFTDRGEYRLA